MSDDSLVCEVCGKNESVGIACSVFGAMSMAYCSDCIRKNRDSYGLLVATAACFPVPSDQIKLEDFREDLRATVTATMKYAGKSWDDLRRESTALLKEMAAYDGGAKGA